MACDCSKIKFKLETTGTSAGHLFVTYDGCSWEDLGLVLGGTGATGPLGLAGPTGSTGSLGSNGTNGISPHIDDNSGNWFIGTTDTGVKAAGTNASIDIEASEDIGVHGTPSVTKRVVNNLLLLKFHQLKGADGETLEVGNKKLSIKSKQSGTTTTVAEFTANQKEDDVDFTLEAGNNITITPDTTNKKVTIAALGGSTPGDKNLKIYAQNISDDSPTLVLSFNANESSIDKSLIVKTGVGLTMLSDPQTNTMTISLENNHIVTLKILVIENGTGSLHEKLYKYITQCSLNGTSIVVCPTDLFGLYNIFSGSNKTFVSTKSATGYVAYMGFLHFGSTSGLGLCLLDIYNSLTLKSETHLVGYIEDTFLEGSTTQGDGTICLITTCSWNLVCKHKHFSTIPNDHLYCYLEIPADFVGTVTLTPLKWSLASVSPYILYRDRIGCVSYNPDTVLGYDEKNWTLVESSTTNITTFPLSELVGDDLPTGGIMNLPVGKYNVDILYNFPYTLLVGTKISDSLVNDCLLHDLSKKVDSIINNTVLEGTSLKLGETTLSEVLLLQLLALLQ